MANDFVLKIGMTTQQVMQNIGNMNANDKTKQLIINFCNNDHDKKITNEIELAMLDSWSKGSEKVKMPTAEGMTEVPNGVPPITLADAKEEKMYRASNNRLFGTIKGGMDSLIACVTNKGYTNTDALFDNNSDGYADWRVTSYVKEYYNNNEGDVILTTRYGDNLDGIYDEKSINKSMTREYRHIDRNTDTDLHTGKVLSDVEYQHEIIETDNCVHGDINTEINHLTGEIQTHKHEHFENKDGSKTEISTSTNSLTGETRVDSTHINDETGDITETTTITDNKTGKVTTRTVRSNSIKGYVTSDTTTVEQPKKTP